MDGHKNLPTTYTLQTNVCSSMLQSQQERSVDKQAKPYRLPLLLLPCLLLFRLFQGASWVDCDHHYQIFGRFVENQSSSTIVQRLVPVSRKGTNTWDPSLCYPGDSAIEYFQFLPPGNDSYDYFIRFILCSGIEYWKILKSERSVFTETKVKLARVFIQNLYGNVSSQTSEEFLDYCQRFYQEEISTCP